MGEAKKRREELRALALRQGARWLFPEAPWEIGQVKEILELPVYQVRRFSPEEIRYMRMPGNECHANSRWYADNDPERLAEHVTGWWVQWPNLVLHSVVRRDGVMRCLTPSPLAEDVFPFIPDPHIEWRDEKDHRQAYRKGYAIDVGLRAFPKVTVAQTLEVQKRLLSGMNPYKATEMSDAEVEFYSDIARREYGNVYE